MQLSLLRQPYMDFRKEMSESNACSRS